MIQPGDNFLDSREIQERIKELRDDVQVYEYEHGLTAIHSDEIDRHPDIAEAMEELEMWEDFKEETSTAEWRFGQTFIHDSMWVEYVQDMIEDVTGDIPWYVEVDWKRTADNVAQDYYCADVDGETYYYRAC